MTKLFPGWQQATRDQLPPFALDLVLSLARYVPPVCIIDKPAYSAFSNPALASLLIEKSVSTIVVTGVETDVCVLSTVLNAVDIGFQGRHRGGRAVQLFRRRARRIDDDVPHALHGQVHLVTSEELMELWRE